MEDRLQKILYDKYPELFKQKDYPMSETCMCWGLDCDDGWYNLIDETCAKIMEINPNNNVQFTQVKEKYGTIRIYFDMKSDGDTFDEDLYKKVNDIIVEAEEKSVITCEECGEPSELCQTKSNYPWLKTLCVKCRGDEYIVRE